MLDLKITDAQGKSLFERTGMTISETYAGKLEAGYNIHVSLQNCEFIAVKLDPTLKESIVWVPNKSLDFVIPAANVLKACYAPGAFSGEEHPISIREPDDSEIYAYREISLNSHDLRGKRRTYPHATANFVTRDEPCFFERNAIDGVIDNSNHGFFPYHSWGGGLREDLEYELHFGTEVEVSSVVLF